MIRKHHLLVQRYRLKEVSEKVESCCFRVMEIGTRDGWDRQNLTFEKE